MEEYKNKEWLYTEYIDKNRTLKDLANECNVCTKTLRKYLKEYNIKKEKNISYKNKDWLLNKYKTERIPAQKIANEHNVSESLIYYYLNKFQISKNRMEGKKEAYKDYDWLFTEYIKKNRTLQSISNEQNICEDTLFLQLKKFNIQKRTKNKLCYDKEWLYNEYVVKKKSVEFIAVECKVNKKTIYKILKMYFIKLHEKRIVSDETKQKYSQVSKKRYNTIESIRKNMDRTGIENTPEAKEKIAKKLRGSLNHRWKGGISSEHKLFQCSPEWEHIAKKIRKKYSYICYNCGKNPSYDVHHIIPWRKTKDNSENNLVLLCKSCHMKSEHNPDYLKLKDWT